MSYREVIASVREVLTRGLHDRVFPAAAVEVGTGHTIIWREALGALAFDAVSPSTSERTFFDLASLTKPIATTSVVLHLVAQGAIALEDRVARLCPDWRGVDRDAATLQDLLEHAAGLPARLPDVAPQLRREFTYEIGAVPLAYAPRTRSIYTDLGFLLLGFVAEDRGGATLEAQFAEVLERVTAPAQLDAGDERLCYALPTGDRSRTAPTDPMPDDRRRGRRLVGEVHDNYAAALGGVAGHAGLFGIVGGVGTFARAVLRGARGDTSIPSPLSPDAVARAVRKSTVFGSSRALGWDTMLPTSSCGTEMSPAAFGHVGFTGTSLWIDPARDRYFVLLTNRVCGGGSSEAMQAIRRAFHNSAAHL